MYVCTKSVYIRTGFTCRLTKNNLQSTMSCVLSDKLAPTPLNAVQVMVTKALSLITLVSMRSLVTLNIAASGVSVLSSSAKSTPSRYQEMVGKGTPVAVHITTAGAPSDTVTVGFCEMVASGATEYEEGMWRKVALSQLTQTMPHTYVAVGKATMQIHRLYLAHNPNMDKPRAICLLILQLKFNRMNALRKQSQTILIWLLMKS